MSACRLHAARRARGRRQRAADPAREQTLLLRRGKAGPGAGRRQPASVTALFERDTSQGVRPVAGRSRRMPRSARLADNKRLGARLRRATRGGLRRGPSSMPKVIDPGSAILAKTPAGPPYRRGRARTRPRGAAQAPQRAEPATPEMVTSRELRRPADELPTSPSNRSARPSSRWCLEETLPESIQQRLSRRAMAEAAKRDIFDGNKDAAAGTRAPTWSPADMAPKTVTPMANADSPHQRQGNAAKYVRDSARPASSSRRARRRADQGRGRAREVRRQVPAAEPGFGTL